jgi:hypothetical protein
MTASIPIELNFLVKTIKACTVLSTYHLAGSIQFNLAISTVYSTRIRFLVARLKTACRNVVIVMQSFYYLLLIIILITLQFMTLSMRSRPNIDIDIHIISLKLHICMYLMVCFKNILQRSLQASTHTARPIITQEHDNIKIVTLTFLQTVRTTDNYKETGRSNTNCFFFA